MTEAEKAAAEYAIQKFPVHISKISGHAIDTNYSRRSLTEETFLTGHTFAMQCEEVQTLVKALKFYAEGMHLELNGICVFEPGNWLSDSPKNGEFIYESGDVAREALKKFREAQK